MSNPTSKTKSRKTTVVLAVILVLLVVFALTIFVILPNYHYYYLTHVKYPLYGGISAEFKDSELYKDMQSGKSFCFMGDSITYGNVNGGIPWYQPLTPNIKGERSSLSHGGWMVLHLIENKDKIPAADVYVIAIGVNDVAVHWTGKASHDSAEFTERIEKLANIIRSKSPNAKIYFISPWIFFVEDYERSERAVQYRVALENWCGKNDCIYINPVPFLASVLDDENCEKYMMDGFHPNSQDGVVLYSYAVLKADLERKTS